MNIEQRARLQHVRALTHRVTLDHTRYPIEFEVAAFGPVVLVRVVAIRPCSLTGKLSPQAGRKWLIEHAHSDEAILQTLLKAVLTYEEHEVREGFKFDGVAIFEPKH